VQIVAVRSAHHNAPASPELVLTENDVVLAVSPDGAALAETRKRLGEAAPGRVLRDRGDLDYLRVFASRAKVVGRQLGELSLPDGSIVAHVRRGDADIMPNPELVLEYGDRVGLLTKRAAFPALRAFFGDSIKGTAEFSYISVGLGMALGFLVGAIQLPLPGIGQLALGLCGVLIVALVLGKLRRTGGIHWTMPLPANLVMRNLGLTIFLAQVGMSSGPRFAATVSQTGLLMLGLGALVLLALVVPILILGLLVYRLPFDELAGIVAGACGNPAILAFANKLTPTEKPDIGYAMIFPAMTIVKILFVDILPALW
jgi:putative transport protein